MCPHAVSPLCKQSAYYTDGVTFYFPLLSGVAFTCRLQTCENVTGLNTLGSRSTVVDICVSQHTDVMIKELSGRKCSHLLPYGHTYTHMISCGPKMFPFFLNLIFMYVYIYLPEFMYVMYVQVPMKTRAGIIGGYELPDVGVKNGAWAL